VSLNASISSEFRCNTTHSSNSRGKRSNDGSDGHDDDDDDDMVDGEVRGVTELCGAGSLVGAAHTDKLQQPVWRHESLFRLLFLTGTTACIERMMSDALSNRRMELRDRCDGALILFAQPSHVNWAIGMTIITNDDNSTVSAPPDAHQPCLVLH